MNQPISPFSQNKSALAANRYTVARNNLLLVIVFTLINVALAIGGGNFYMLFSASIPYGIAGFTAAWARTPEQIDMEPACRSDHGSCHRSRDCGSPARSLPAVLDIL